MTGGLHLIKLCVGAESVDDQRAWIETRMAERRAAGLDERSRHVTRMWPKRAGELLDGGSLYWVIKGVLQARQKIEALEEVIGDDGIRRCAIIMSPKLILTESRPRRAFQGWRYLPAGDAPPDLHDQSRHSQRLPTDLALALDGLGVVAR